MSTCCCYLLLGLKVCMMPVKVRLKDKDWYFKSYSTWTRTNQAKKYCCAYWGGCSRHCYSSLKAVMALPPLIFKMNCCVLFQDIIQQSVHAVCSMMGNLKVNAKQKDVWKYFLTLVTFLLTLEPPNLCSWSITLVVPCCYPEYDGWLGGCVYVCSCKRAVRHHTLGWGTTEYSHKGKLGGGGGHSLGVPLGRRGGRLDSKVYTA